MFWLIARLSLIPAACLLYGKFAISEGWKMSKRFVLPLIGMFLLISVLGIVLSLLFNVINYFVLSSSLTNAAMSQAATIAPTDPVLGVSGIQTPSMIAIIIATVLSTVLVGILTTMNGAAFASAAKQIKEVRDRREARAAAQAAQDAAAANSPREG